MSSPVEDSLSSSYEDSLCDWVGESLMELLSSFWLSVSVSISSSIVSMRAALVAGGRLLMGTLKPSFLSSMCSLGIPSFLSSFSMNQLSIAGRGSS